MCAVPVRGEPLPVITGCLFAHLRWLNGAVACKANASACIDGVWRKPGGNESPLIFSGVGRKTPHSNCKHLTIGTDAQELVVPADL